MKKLAFSSVLAFIAISLVGSPIAKAALVFDDITTQENAGFTNVTSTGSTPNTFMGDAYTLSTGTKDITGFDIYPVNLSGTNYTGLQATIYVWGTVNTGTVSATAPAFSNLLGSYTVTSTGTYNTGFIYSFESATPGVTPGISLTTPLSLSSTTIGLTISYAGTTNGTTYATANSLTSAISYGSAPTTGTEVFNGYYRNANSETNGNFTSTLRSLSLTNQSLALRVYGDVTAAPEPSTWAMMGLGVVGVVAALRRRRVS